MDISTFKSDKLLLVEFGADWCAPCKAQEPILNKLQQEYNDIVEIRKVDIDKDYDLANSLSIRSVPTLVFFKDGDLKEATVGLTGIEKLKEKIIRWM
ncbi:MAG TPA: thioredoxin family protein [Candidatus Paceibacterota bacterium]|nr:thioredoxin family protein [Candidatus Paceibacterota bacterium]